MSNMQSVLRQKFWFRVVTLIFAVTSMVSYFFLPPEIGNFLLGIGASALIWAIVETVDFFIETFHKYVLERNDFYRLVIMNYRNMKTIIKEAINNKTGIPWQKVRQSVDKLYSDVAPYPLRTGETFALSKEFEDAEHYITRLYWKINACLFNQKETKLDVEEYEKLYACFILDNQDKVSLKKSSSEFNKIKSDYQRLTEIEVNTEKIELPEGFLQLNNKGDIKESIDLITGERELKTFLPQQDFQKIIPERAKNKTFLTVISLIFRKVEY